MDMGGGSLGEIEDTDLVRFNDAEHTGIVGLDNPGRGMVYAAAPSEEDVLQMPAEPGPDSVLDRLDAIDQNVAGDNHSLLVPAVVQEPSESDFADEEFGDEELEAML